MWDFIDKVFGRGFWAEANLSLTVSQLYYRGDIRPGINSLNSNFCVGIIWTNTDSQEGSGVLTFPFIKKYAFPSLPGSLGVTASCWHRNSHGNMYTWHKKNGNLQHYFFLRQFGSFRCNRFVLLFFYASVTVLMVRMKDDRFPQVVAEHVTIIWPVLFWSLDDLFRWKYRTTSYFKECFSN